MRTVLIIAALSAAGCHHWARPGTPDDVARQAHYECVQEAHRAGGDNLARGYYRDVCMEARGFRWVWGR